MPPYGIAELDPVVRSDPARPGRVGCYVRGCAEWLRPARDVCPRHGIVCHRSRYGPTYSYPDARRNVIVAPDLLAARVVGHPFKYESGRLGLEKSEDALTWNMFRSLQEAGRLNEVARLVTCRSDDAEPVLYLWGLRLTGDALTPWDLLVVA